MRTFIKTLVCLFISVGLWDSSIAQEVYYEPVAEWNGPYYHVMNGDGRYALGLVDQPVIDIAFEGSNAAAAWFDGTNYITAVVDEVNDRIQFFLSDVFIDEETAFTWVGPGVPAAAGQYNATAIWFDPGAANTIVPGSEVLSVNDIIWSRVEDLTGYTSADRVYTMDYTGGAGGGAAAFPAASLADGDDIQIQYANSTSLTDGVGDIDYLKAGAAAAGGLAQGQTIQIDEIYPTTGGAPASFENLSAAAVNASRAGAGVMDFYAVDAADATDKLFSYRLNSDASTFEWVSTYEGSLTNPADVDIEESGDNALYVASAVTQFTTANTPTLTLAVTNNALVTNHTYTFTVLTANPVPAAFDGLTLAVYDATTETIINYLAPTGAGPVVYNNVIPGIQITWTLALVPASAVVGESATINPATTEAVIRDFLFVCDTGNDRIKIIKGAENGVAAANGTDADYFAGTQRTDYYWISDGATPTMTFVAACRAEENSFELYTGNAGGRTQWTQVVNFHSSGPGDQHYTYDYDSQIITLGDGVFGAIPAAGDTALAVYDESIDVLDYGSAGSGEGNFSAPSGVAAHYNTNYDWYDVYVADTGNDRIAKFRFIPGEQSNPGSASVIWVTAWDYTSSTINTLDEPTGIAVEDDGAGQLFLYVCDTENDRVVVYRDTESELGGGGGSAAPEYNYTIGSTGTTLGEFTRPRGIAAVDFGTDVDVYVADSDRGWVEKFQALPVADIDLDYSNISSAGYPPDGSYTFTAVNPTFALNPPPGAYVQFFFSDSADAASPTLCSDTQVSPNDGTFNWIFSQTPSGTPADGSYYLYARLYSHIGTMLDQDVTTSQELLTIQSDVGEGLSALDALDGDAYLCLQNGAERVINLTIDDPDSVTGVSFQGTYPSAFISIVGFTEGSAWGSVQQSSTIFTAAWDSAAGTYTINAAVLGSNTGLTNLGRNIVATGRIRVMSSAVTLERRNTYGEFTILQGRMMDYKGEVISNATLNNLNLRFAYLGDISAVDSAVGDPPNMVPYPDGAIDFEDLVAFTKGWNGVGGQHDAIADIGPASGTVPDLVSAPDGAWDVFDLIAFTQMIRWYGSQNIASSAGAWGFPAYIDNPGVITADGRRDGGGYQLRISLDDASQAVCAEIAVEYDPQVCQFLTAAEGDFLSGGESFFTHFDTEGKVELYASRLEAGAAPEGNTIAELRFQTSEDTYPAFTIGYDLRDLEGRIIDCGRFDFNGEGLPRSYALNQNYPNPFNPETAIEFELPQAGKVKMAVYNLKGELVTMLLDEFRAAGYHRVVWDSRITNGPQLSSGIYFYTLSAGDFRAVKKMVLLK